MLTLSDTGSRVLLRSLEEFERLRGTNLAWFGVDELTYTTEESWLRLKGVCAIQRRRGYAALRSGRPRATTGSTAASSKTATREYEVIRAQPMENRHVLEGGAGLL